MSAPQIRNKKVAENLPFTCGFALRLDGAVLTSATVVAEPDDLSIAAVSINDEAIYSDGELQAIGQAVQTGVSGGTASQRYVLTVTASIAGGGTVSEDCILEVE